MSTHICTVLVVLLNKSFIVVVSTTREVLEEKKLSKSDSSK